MPRRCPAVPPRETIEAKAFLIFTFDFLLSPQSKRVLNFYLVNPQRHLILNTALTVFIRKYHRDQVLLF